MPSSCHQVEYQYTVGRGGKSWGRHRHWHLVLAAYKIASTICRRGCFSRRPRRRQQRLDESPLFIGQIGRVSLPRTTHTLPNEPPKRPTRQISNALSGPTCRSILAKSGTHTVWGPTMFARLAHPQEHHAP